MKRITSIGEILFDVYEDRKTMGGAPFNFVYHVIKLTGQGNFISRIGNDNLGEEIRQFFSKKLIPADYLQIDKKHKTGVAKTVLDDRKIPTFTIEENRAYDFIEQNDDLIRLIKNNTDCLYFGSLAQRNKVSRETIRKLSNFAPIKFCDLNLRQNFYSKEIIERQGEANVDLAGRTFKIKKQFLEDLESVRMQQTIQNLNRALLIFHAPTDSVVGIDNAAQIFMTARHPKSFISLDNADHLLMNPKDSHYVGALIAAWASKYIETNPENS